MFRYTVTKDDFTEMTVYLMKQKSAKTSSKVKLVLFTIVQMAVIAWLIIVGKDVSPVIRILMGVFSLLWAAQTIFSYGFYKVRAKMMLTNQADNDKSGDFWKEHRLQLQGAVFQGTGAPELLVLIELIHIVDRADAHIVDLALRHQAELLAVFADHKLIHDGQLSSLLIGEKIHGEAALAGPVSGEEEAGLDLALQLGIGNAELRDAGGVRPQLV